MVALFIDGFDKYGPAWPLYVAGGAIPSANLLNALEAGEWNSTTLPNGQGAVAIAPGLSSTGYALAIEGGLSVAVFLTKTLPGNISPLIAGFRFSTPLTAANVGVILYDGITAQASVSINVTTGNISVRSGGITGTALATSSASVTANTTHYLEFDIAIGTSASYQVWLDGVSIISGTGNTRGGTSDNYVNSFSIGANPDGAFLVFDDLYLFDSTGSTNNAVLNTNPRIETQFPTGDSSVQFTFGGATLGQTYSTVIATNAPGANELFLRPFIPTLNCTINSIACVPEATSATAHNEAVIYSDSSNSPHSLLSGGTAVTGTTANAALTSALTTPQSLIAGTRYWLGFITDTSVVLAEVDSTTTGEKAANTYTSGPPATAPAMTTNQSSWVLWGNITGTGVNYYEVDANPQPDSAMGYGGGTGSYVYDSTPGQEDLYNFPNLTATPSAIYTVAVKALIENATSGARTINLVTKSGATTGTGSDSGQSPGTSYIWMDSFFTTDPNTSAAWTASGLNNATSGVEIAS